MNGGRWSLICCFYCQYLLKDNTKSLTKERVVFNKESGGQGFGKIILICTFLFNDNRNDVVLGDTNTSREVLLLPSLAIGVLFCKKGREAQYGGWSGQQSKMSHASCLCPCCSLWFSLITRGAGQMSSSIHLFLSSAPNSHVANPILLR